MLFHLFHEASNCGNITQFSWKSDKSTYVLDKESHCHFLIDDHVTFLTVVSHDYSVGNGSNLTWLCSFYGVYNIKIYNVEFNINPILSWFTHYTKKFPVSMAINK